jgi:endonuclease YncB( thermonuclease family)
VVAVAVWTLDPVTVGSASAAATVVDGDTLKFGHEKIRLHGIDAPKSQQRCVDGWQAGYTEVGRSPRQHGAAHDARVHQPQDRPGRIAAVVLMVGEEMRDHGGGRCRQELPPVLPWPPFRS